MPGGPGPQQEAQERKPHTEMFLSLSSLLSKNKILPPPKKVFPESNPSTNEQINKIVIYTYNRILFNNIKEISQSQRDK